MEGVYGVFLLPEKYFLFEMFKKRFLLVKMFEICFSLKKLQGEKQYKKIL